MSLRALVLPRAMQPVKINAATTASTCTARAPRPDSFKGAELDRLDHQGAVPVSHELWLRMSGRRICAGCN